ncbi:hypothetical protein B0H13DRAFT_2343762 [Mycena leptocephala]|nr:hypothetical protein B0H13DRAFT_2343762 [Mycena leptocephala]
MALTKFQVALIKLVSAALLADLAFSASCSSGTINGGNTECAQRVANRMCATLGCGGDFNHAVGTAVHVEGQMFNGACPNNCAEAVSEILSQCIANDHESGVWQVGGEWYWIYSVRNTPAGSADC